MQPTLLCIVPEVCPEDVTAFWSEGMQATYCRSVMPVVLYGQPQVMCNFQRFYVCAYTLSHREHLPWRLEANLVSTLRLPCTRNSSSAIYIHGKESVILCIYPVHLCVCLLRRICIFRMPVQPPCIMNKIVAVIHMRRNLHCVCFSISAVMYDVLLNL
jgi:hypothetical protein